MYIYVTYWLGFPYDVYPGDVPEYEPFTIIIDRYSYKPIKYRFKV